MEFEIIPLPKEEWKGTPVTPIMIYKDTKSVLTSDTFCSRKIIA